MLLLCQAACSAPPLQAKDRVLHLQAALQDTHKQMTRQQLAWLVEEFQLSDASPKFV